MAARFGAKTVSELFLNVDGLYLERGITYCNLIGWTYFALGLCGRG